MALKWAVEWFVDGEESTFNGRSSVSKDTGAAGGCYWFTALLERSRGILIQQLPFSASEHEDNRVLGRRGSGEGLAL